MRGGCRRGCSVLSPRGTRLPLVIVAAEQVEHDRIVDTGEHFVSVCGVREWLVERDERQRCRLLDEIEEPVAKDVFKPRLPACLP